MNPPENAVRRRAKPTFDATSRVTSDDCVGPGRIALPPAWSRATSSV